MQHSRKGDITGPLEYFVLFSSIMNKLSCHIFQHCFCNVILPKHMCYKQYLNVFLPCTATEKM